MRAGPLVPPSNDTDLSRTSTPVYAHPLCPPLAAARKPAQPVYPAHDLAGPRYGLPPQPPPTPQPDQRDLEMVYLRGQLASLDRRPAMEHPVLPQATQPAPQPPKHDHAAVVESLEARARCLQLPP